jgi:hypothetical protein
MIPGDEDLGDTGAAKFRGPGELRILEKLWGRERLLVE